MINDVLEMFKERYPICNWGIDDGCWITQNKGSLIRYNVKHNTWKIFTTDEPCGDHVGLGNGLGFNKEVDFDTMCDHYDLNTLKGGFI